MTLPLMPRTRDNNICEALLLLFSLWTWAHETQHYIKLYFYFIFISVGFNCASVMGLAGIVVRQWTDSDDDDDDDYGYGLHTAQKCDKSVLRRLASRKTHKMCNWAFWIECGNDASKVVWTGVNKSVDDEKSARAAHVCRVQNIHLMKQITNYSQNSSKVTVRIFCKAQGSVVSMYAGIGTLRSHYSRKDSFAQKRRVSVNLQYSLVLWMRTNATEQFCSNVSKSFSLFMFSYFTFFVWSEFEHRCEPTSQIWACFFANIYFTHLFCYCLFVRPFGWRVKLVCKLCNLK